MLCLQKWGFAVASQTLRATGERKELLFTSQWSAHIHTDTHTCTRSEVPVLHFLIHCYSPSPPAWSFYDSLSSSCAVWLQEGTSLLNSPCIFRGPIIKEGARAVKQWVGKLDINTSSLLGDSWTPDMRGKKTQQKKEMQIRSCSWKHVIRGAQNLPVEGESHS